MKTEIISITSTKVRLSMISRGIGMYIQEGSPSPNVEI